MGFVGQPTISVLLPAYNVQDYVGEAIDSVLSQTLSDWELLIADDGSTDNTRQILDSYDDPRIRRFHNETRFGLAITRNKLVSHARGEFITSQDGDDTSIPFRFERLMQAFKEQPELFLCGSNSYRRFGLSGKRMVTDYPLSHEEIVRFISKHKSLPFTGSSVAFRRAILTKVVEFRPYFNMRGSDLDFFLRASELYRVGNVPEALYEYRYSRHGNSRTVDHQSFLKIYVSQIVFFLAEQRSQSLGLDGLMEGGDREGFDQFVENLRRKYQKDISVIYRHACRTKISNEDYLFAILDALRAIRTNPKVAENYTLILHSMGSMIKAIIRGWRRYA
jgi:glycosyltransferase involved in cell wall biosynthesis